MSTAMQAPGASGASSPVRPAHAGTPGRKPGDDHGNPLFAQLLTLASDTQAAEDVPTVLSPATGTDDEAPGEGTAPPAMALNAPLPGGSDAPGPTGPALGTEVNEPADATAPAEGWRADPSQTDPSDAAPSAAVTGGMTRAAGAPPAEPTNSPTLSTLASGEPTPAADTPARPLTGPAARGGRPGGPVNAAPPGLQGFQWRQVPGPSPGAGRGLGEARGLTGVASLTASHAMAHAAMTQSNASRAASRSTVALHDRFGAAFGTTPLAPEAPVSGTTLAWVSALAPGAGLEARLSPAGPAASPVGSEAGPAEAADAAPSDTPPGLADTAAQVAEEEARQISHWGTQTLRHASLRVGQDGGDAIDIRLSLAGQEVQVDFRTDNADARASLQQNAPQSLAELLQRSGIQLGGVSVGAQGQGTGQGASPDARAAERTRSQAGAARVAGVAAGADRLSSPATPRPRADGSQPLDLFV